MTIRSKWPKKTPVRDYIAIEYTDGAKSSATVIRQIQNGDLPGVKDGGRWFVYVLPDGSPAYGYNENQPDRQEEETVKLTGNALADAILAKQAANNGFKVAS